VTGYILGAAVEFDLDEIREYIAADNIDAADRWIGKRFDAFGWRLPHLLPRRTPTHRDRGRDPRLTRHPCFPELPHSQLRLAQDRLFYHTERFQSF